MSSSQKAACRLDSDSQAWLPVPAIVMESSGKFAAESAKLMDGGTPQKGPNQFCDAVGMRQIRKMSRRVHVFRSRLRQPFRHHRVAFFRDDAFSLTPNQHDRCLDFLEPLNQRSVANDSRTMSDRGGRSEAAILHQEFPTRRIERRKPAAMIRLLDQPP